tara:strand:+ start:156 stop:1118 length:963 start_codon:yes stop_codon:yes gene_type:complete
MAVFTRVVLKEIIPWASQFPIGNIISLKDIQSGIENSNFFLSTDKGEYVLTIFEKLSLKELAFCINLMRHLAVKKILVPAPIINYRGEIISTLHGKPATVVTKLEGNWKSAPTFFHCEKVGDMLAKMHLASLDYHLYQPNLRGLAWWNSTIPKVLPFITKKKQNLLESELSFQKNFISSMIYKSLPKGPIHADLFRNNVMFDKEKLSGFFDFYFAGFDTWLFDIAVAVNDWCIELSTGKIDDIKAKSMLSAYNKIRPFSLEEKNAWPSILRAAAFRFWLSRLYDYYVPREAHLLTPHDPMHFEQILEQRIINFSENLLLK